MRSRVASFSLALVTLFLLALQPAFARHAATASNASPKHPEIAATQACKDCHGTEYADWRASKHGHALVKCLVCHGAVDSNFIPHPTASRCLACHGEIVRHLGDGPPTKDKSCFACHSSHRLNPHAHVQGVQQ